MNSPENIINIKSTLQNKSDNYKLSILFYILISILLISNALLQTNSLYFFAIIMMMIYIIMSKPENNYYLVTFILPSLATFVSADSQFSYATILLLIAFTKHFVGRFKFIKFDKYGLFTVLALIFFELLHIHSYSSPLIIQSIRWASLFLYPSMVMIDRNFKLNFKKLVLFFALGIFISSICGALSPNGTGASINHLGLSRFEGAGSDPNVFAMMTLLALLFVMNILHFEKKIYLLIALVGLVFIGFMTLSRTYFIAISIVHLLILS